MEDGKSSKNFSKLRAIAPLQSGYGLCCVSATISVLFWAWLILFIQYFLYEHLKPFCPGLYFTIGSGLRKSEFINIILWPVSGIAAALPGVLAYMVLGSVEYSISQAFSKDIRPDNDAAKVTDKASSDS